MEETDCKHTTESLSNPEAILKDNSSCCGMTESSSGKSGNFTRKRSESFSDELENYKKQKFVSRASENSNSIILDESCAILHYSNYEITEKLQNEETFKDALELLSECLKQNICTESNAFDFYIFFQNIQSQFLRLVERRDEFERKSNRDFIEKSCTLLAEIDKVFCLYKQKAWKYFSPTQRKSVNLWIKHFKEWKAAFLEDLRTFKNDSENISDKFNYSGDSDFEASPEERNEIPSREEQINLQETELEILDPNQKKQVIFLKNCVLYPPDNEISIGKKPVDCRTVLVSNLPEKITKEVIEEIFGLCGIIKTIWQPFKRFCHVQYTDSIFADNAVHFSGYKLKIQNKDENTYCSMLHVVYLYTKDYHIDHTFDKQSSQVENNKLIRSLSTHCTDVKDLCDKLKNKFTFQEAASRLITWLETEDCDEINVDFIISVIKATNQHVTYLLTEKDEIEEELSREHREHDSLNSEKTFNQCTLIFKIYDAALSQRCQNNFSEEERENIKAWKEQVEEFCNSLIEKRENYELREAVNKLRKERDFLKRELAAVEEEKRNLQRFFEEEIRLKNLQYQRSLNELNYLRLSAAHLHIVRQVELRRMQEEERSTQEAVPDSSTTIMESIPSDSM